MKSKRVGSLAIASLVPALYLLHFPISGSYFLSSDTSHLFYVVKRWFWSWIAEGEFPLWNEGLFNGIYQMASPAHEIFSPLTAPFFWFLPGYWATLAYLTLAVSLASSGAYLLARRMDLEPSSALAFAWAFALCGPLLSLVDRSPIFVGVSLYPWLGYLAFRMREAVTWGRASALAIVLALLVHHGDWVATAIFGPVALFVVLSNTRNKLASASNAILIGYIVLLAFLLSAVVLLPTSANLQWIDRGSGWTYEQASYFSFHPLRLLQLIGPEAWGQMADKTFWGEELSNALSTPRYWYHSIWLGSAPLALIGFGLWSVKRSKIWLLLLVPIVVFASISFGIHAPVHGWLFNWFSWYAKLRYPEKFVLYSLALLALYAIPGLRLLQASRRKQVAFWWTYAGLHLLGLWIEGALADNYGAGKLAAGQLATSAIIHSILTAVGGALAIYTSKGREGSRPFLVLPVVVAAELIAFAPAQVLEPSKKFESESEIVKVLETSGHAKARVIRDFNIDVNGDPDFRRTLTYNWGLLSGLRYVYGYETIVPARNHRLLSDEVFVHLPAWSHVLDYSIILAPNRGKDVSLRGWAEKRLVSVLHVAPDLDMVVLAIDRRPTRVSFASSSLVAEDEEAAFERTRTRGADREPVVFERGQAFLDGERMDAISADAVMASTAMAVSPEWKIISETRSANSRSFEVETSAPGWLVMHESFHPSWSASVNGEVVPTVRADYVNAAFRIPAGKSVVAYEFRPKEWVWAVALSLTGLLISVVILGFARLRRAPFPS